MATKVTIQEPVCDIYVEDRMALRGVQQEACSVV
jgi:hypothetical protein